MSNTQVSNSELARPLKDGPEDLIRDPRVRLEIKEILFRDMHIGIFVCLCSSAIIFYQFIKWPEPIYLTIFVIGWIINSILYQCLNYYNQSRSIERRQQSSYIEYCLKLYSWSAWLDAIFAGLITLFLFIYYPDWILTEVIGVVLYVFGTFMKNMHYAHITRLLPTLMLLPLAIAFLISKQTSLIMLGCYFIIFAIGITIYSKNIANIIQLPIKQRFELEELTSQLNIERERADAANAAKSHFFTAASHDARQPLQVISLLFQSFQKSTQASDQDKKIIQKIDINLKTIRNLFDRVLDISRIDSGNVTPNMQSVKLQSLFDKFDAQFGELAASKGLWLRFVPTEVWVEHDIELLDRIVSNLVHNAIKYTPAGGVWVAWRGARGKLEVRDSGLGISAVDQQTIFQEFAQLNNPARNNEAGLGLGLSIVKRLADLTNTPLGLNSKIGKGSTFWVQLNKTQFPMLQHTSKDISKDASKDASTNLPAIQSTNLTAQNSTTADTQVVIASGSNQLSGVHILYAEDEPQIRELFSQLLQDAGAVVYPCADVTEAIAILNTKLAVDIVLTDYRLGATGTGLDVVHAARTRHSGLHTDHHSKLESDHLSDHLPAVILTGDTAIKDLQSIQQLPDSTLLHKPVDFEHLAGVLKTVITPKK